MERRKFIQTTSASLLAGMLMPRTLYAGSPSKYAVGLQLYSLREEISKDLEGSLEKVGKIGYDTVEVTGYSKGTFYGLPPKEFKHLVGKYGMKASCSHLTFSDGEVSEVMEAHKEAGIQHLVWPWIGADERKSIADYKILAKKLNTFGKIFRDNGLYFGYHNHDFEFHPLDGLIPYDILLEKTDPGAVFMEIDLYWIKYAGKDPLAYFKKYPGRFKIWHVKDMAAGESKKMTEVGSGIIDYKELFGQASLAGMQQYFVEQDVIEGNRFDSVRKSYNYLHNNF